MQSDIVSSQTATRIKVRNNFHNAFIDTAGRMIRLHYKAIKMWNYLKLHHM